MQATAPEKNIHRLFIASLIVKAFDGIVLILVGSTFLFFGPESLSHFYDVVASSELSETPRDGLFAYLHQLFQNLSVSSGTFVGIYVLAHGLLNIFLVVGIYREKLWVYLVAIGCIGLFVVYQVYRLSHAFSLAIFILTLFDLLFIALTWHEYSYHRARLSGGGKF